MPINLEDQEVLCSNCYETIPMSAVDKHSAVCHVESQHARASARAGGDGRATTMTVDEEQEYRAQTEELNERIADLEHELEAAKAAGESSAAGAVLDQKKKIEQIQAESAAKLQKQE